MSDAEFIDDRGEAGPEDNVEWLRWAADTYASAVARGGCYEPEPDWNVEVISPRLREAAVEIERLRARVAVLERLARESLHVLTCNEDDDDPGHRCSHCDDYVDRNGPHRNALRAALEAKP
jgi:hypothetical protein